MKSFLKYFLCGSILFLCACYQFDEEPFSDDELMPFSETKAGKKLVNFVAELANTLPNQGEMPGEDQLVFEVSDTVVAIQKKNEKGKWDVEVMIVESQHLMFCTLFDNSDIPTPPGVEVKEKEEMGIKTFSVSGSPSEKKTYLSNLIAKGLKLCIAKPL